MSHYDYDLFVIGAGSGGVRASRIAASLGARAAVCEERYLGGTCVNVGCVPKKLFVYASAKAHDLAHTEGFGLSHDGFTFDWPTLRDNKTREIERLNGIYDRMLDTAGVEVIDGHGKLIDPHTVEVGGRRYTAETIIIATGGWPFVPTFSGSEHAITSNEAFYLDEFPKRVLVVGGGYIAVEFAGIFNGLGAETSLYYRRDLILRGFDQEIRQFVSDSLTDRGIQMTMNAEIERIEKLEDGTLRTHCTNGNIVDFDCVMYATGRAPNLDNLGIDDLGISLNHKGSIQVNEWYQTNIPNIHALGDVIGRVELTPVALAEGMALAHYLYDKTPPRPVNYDNIATAVFCQPNIGTVGLTEEHARQQYGQVDVYISTFKPMQYSLTGEQEKTLMKLIVDANTDRVVGVHMAGPDAGEIIQGIGIAIIAGATKDDFDRTIGIHPTSAEEFVTMRSKTR